MTDISALEAWAGQVAEAAEKSTAAAQKQHEYVNGDASKDVLTESGPVPSIAKQVVLAQNIVTEVLKDVSAQLATAAPYDSIEEGLGVTPNGGAFTVRSLDPKVYRYAYVNRNGVAVPDGTYSSASAVTTIEDDLKIIADRSTDRFYNGKKVFSAEADSSGSPSIVTLEDGSVEIPKLVLAGSALELVQDRIDTAVAGTATVDAIWPTTALGALAQASRRRVDFVMIGDSNQKKDGYGWGGGLMRALHDRFGCYATAVGAQTPISFSGYTLTGESNYGVGGGATHVLPTEVAAVSPGYSFELPEGSLAGMGPAYLADGLMITSGASAGGVGVAVDHAIGVSNLLRAHYAWVSLTSGAGVFQVKCRIDGSPFTVIASGPSTPTNTGENSLHRQTLDIPAGIRTKGLECKWYVPGGSALVGPFAPAWFRLENPAKHSGVSVSTFYGAGGQSLYDMANYLLTAPMQVLINWFGETRRLQLLAGQKPMVVVYINSALNDQNETLTPSFGWRESIDAKSSTAYLDNLEAIAKRISDVWQKAGWDQEELFFMVMPSHPVSNPDAPKLIGYRKAAFSFAQNRQRASFIDLTLITDADEILANSWYMGVGGSDRNHLFQVAYKTLGARAVALIPELAV
ncbi:hypothetical protein [Pseudomonas sp. HY2-MNA-CIBAN-0224]|uniref:hypothetical protein n=1 Tax=Pseudomonas sp. HY2-MNA-CIBAN-0224 TaxID=3140471 RepID=UPI003326DC48